MQLPQALLLVDVSACVLAWAVFGFDPGTVPPLAVAMLISFAGLHLYRRRL